MPVVEVPVQALFLGGCSGDSERLRRWTVVRLRLSRCSCRFRCQERLEFRVIVLDGTRSSAENYLGVDVLSLFLSLEGGC